MGNNITKKYDVPKEHTATAGHLQLWKIWPAKSKDTGAKVSIWAFDKADLSKNTKKPSTTSSNNSPSLVVTDKAILEQIFQIMKRDLTAMKEQQSCSSIISCLEVVEESKSSLVCVTERVVCSLADMLSNFENIPGGVANHSDFFDSNDCFSEIEISRGFLQLAQGLQYLHNVQHKLHLNLSPESIVITASGHWKICAFGFSLGFSQTDQQRLASPYFLKTPSQVGSSASSSAPVRLEPDLRYCAPEISDGGYNPPSVRYLTSACDAFSLALVMYDAYRYNIKLPPRERVMFRPTVTIMNNDISQHLLALDLIRTCDFTFLSSGIDHIMVGMLQLNTQVRSTVNDLVNNPYFVTGARAVLNTLETIHTRDIGAQSSCLINLETQVTDFPPRILKFVIVPTVGQLCATSPELWELAIPLHRAVASMLSVEHYRSIAGPFIASGLTNASSTEAIQAFLYNLDFIIKIFDIQFFQNNVTILFCNALGGSNNFLQNAAFEKLWNDDVVTRFDKISLSEKLVPALCKEACKNSEPNVKMQALFNLSLVAGKLDPAFIVANILPSLKYITDNDRSPTIAVHVIGCYEAIADGVGPENIAKTILPNILPLLMERGMNKLQFQLLVDLMKMLLRRVTDVRCQELAMEFVSFSEVAHKERADPFSGAKALIMNTREMTKSRSISSNRQSTTTYGAGATTSNASRDVPPPPPSMPPPPPPSMPPPPLPAGSTSDPIRPVSVPSYAMSQQEQSLWSASIRASAETTYSNSSLAPTSQYNSAFSSSAAVNPGSSVSTAVPPPIKPPKPDITPSSTPTTDSKAQLASTSSQAAASSRSSYSWFTSSKPKEIAKEESYTPPLISAVSSPSGRNNTTDLALDVDDFVKSFAKPAVSAPAPANSFPTLSSSTMPMAPMTGQQQFGILPTASTASNSTPVSVLEAQIRQTQEQLAKFSAKSNPPQSSASFTPSSAFPSTALASPSASTIGSYSSFPSASTGGYTSFPSNPSGSNPAPLTYSSPPSYAASSSGNVMNFNDASSAASATPATTLYGNVPSSTSSNNSTQSMFPASNNFSSNAGYTAPSQGYQPPMGSMGMTNNMTAINSGNMNGGWSSGYSGAGNAIPTGFPSGSSYYPSPMVNQQMSGGSTPSGIGYYGAPVANTSAYSQPLPTAANNTNRIGQLPVYSGYQPPAGMPQQQQPQQQQARRSSANSSFDLLN